MAELEQDLEFLEGFLGREPDMDVVDARAFEFFWICRRSTPGDQPIDTLKAIGLYERLYGEVDAMDLSIKLSSMDSVFCRHSNEKLAAAADSRTKKKKD